MQKLREAALSRNMTGKKVPLKIPDGRFIGMFFCLSGILVILFAVLLPRQQLIRDIQQENLSLREQLDVQRTLAPVYEAWKTRTQKGHAAVLPCPKKSGLHRDRIALLPVTLTEVAVNAGLQAVQVTPELSGSNGPGNSLFVHLVLRGEFKKLRSYLIGLGNLSFLERIEEIKITQTPDGPEYAIRVRLAVEQGF